MSAFGKVKLQCPANFRIDFVFQMARKQQEHFGTGLTGSGRRFGFNTKQRLHLLADGKPGAVQTALHGIHTESQYLGNFRRTQTLDIAKEEHVAIHGLQ